MARHKQKSSWLPLHLLVDTPRERDHLSAAAPSALAGDLEYRADPGERVVTLARSKPQTLQDRPRLLRVRPTTVAHLVSLPRPTSVPQTRLPFERHIFALTATVTLVRREADQDLHLVLRSQISQMIAEAPNAPVCTPYATALRKRQMREARGKVHVCARARIVGVAFWDYFHGQTGVAPNAIELHPILGFACLSD